MRSLFIIKYISGKQYPRIMQNQGYIRKHLSYINLRIDQVSAYFRKLNPEGEGIDTVGNPLLLHLLKILTGEQPVCARIPLQVRETLAELQNLIHRWDILSDGDILGYLYQRLKTSGEKKKMGQYFTPPAIVNYMIDKVFCHDTDPFNIKLLDPACGSGQFLIAACIRLNKLLTFRGITKAKTRLNVLHDSIAGLDTDPAAVYITNFNLMRITNVDEYNYYNIHNIDYILSPLEESILPKRSYDIIIGNPPWGSPLNTYQKQLIRRRYISSRSGINTFTLFIERSLELLPDEGKLAFLVPEAYLNIKAHTVSRQHLLGMTCLENITLWGEQFKGVFAPSISFIARKTTKPEARRRNIVSIQNPLERRNGTAHLVPQENYLSTHHHIFNIHYSRRAVHLLSRIDEQDCFYLLNRVQFFLGIVTGNNPKYLSTERTSQFPDPILIGKDIQQYSIQFSGHYFKYDTGSLQQVAPREFYITKNKLLYKFIGRHLVFALDTNGYFSLNNLNGIIPNTIPIQSEVLITMLNSRVLQYYYEKNFFTVKVLRGNLEKLPIKKLRQSSQKKLYSLYMQLTESCGEEAVLKLRENIEDIVYYEYGIHDRDAAAIEQTFRNEDTSGYLTSFVSGIQ